ncbi:MAG: sugar phosphate isomerase/epimerase family protein [Gaiellales bacterium]
MKLGFLTVPFADWTLERVVSWAAGNGFSALEVACWPAGRGDARRYGGVTHIDVAAMDDVSAGDIRRTLASHGVEISGLGFYPNNLHPDPGHRAAANEHLLEVIEAAATLEVPVVNTFAGNDKDRPLPENLDEFEKVFAPLARRAEELGVRLAIENCPMLFSYDEWPGGNNLAHSPASWRAMFEAVPSPSLGLNLDPSHLVWQMIDYERAIYDFADRIYHVHAKDLEVRPDGLYEHGVMSLGMGWQVPRLPGLGEVRWDRFLAALYGVGYDGPVVIEHEDRRFEGSDEAVIRGFRLARDVLSPYIV